MALGLQQNLRPNQVRIPYVHQGLRVRRFQNVKIDTQGVPFKPSPGGFIERLSLKKKKRKKEKNELDKSMIRFLHEKEKFLKRNNKIKVVRIERKLEMLHRRKAKLEDKIRSVIGKGGSTKVSKMYPTPEQIFITDMYNIGVVVIPVIGLACLLGSSSLGICVFCCFCIKWCKEMRQSREGGRPNVERENNAQINDERAQADPVLESKYKKDVPVRYLCQLTEKLMETPVQDIFKNVYEKKAIIAWVDKKEGTLECPMSPNQFYAHSTPRFIHLKNLQVEIEKWKEENRIRPKLVYAKGPVTLQPNMIKN